MKTQEMLEALNKALEIMHAVELEKIYTAQELEEDKVLSDAVCAFLDAKIALSDALWPCRNAQ